MPVASHLPLPGVLDTVAAESLRQALLGARGQPLTLDGSSSLRVGGAALQVLLSARRQWIEDGHSWTIDAPSAALRDALELMGASDLLGESMND